MTFTDWCPDGQRLAYTENNRGEGTRPWGGSSADDPSPACQEVCVIHLHMASGTFIHTYRERMSQHRLLTPVYGGTPLSSRKLT